MKPSKVTLGDIDDYVEIDDKPELTLFQRLFCCICLYFEPKSNVIRIRKKVVEFNHEDPSEKENALRASAELAEQTALQLKQSKSATKIQAVARGRQGRQKAKQAYRSAIAMIDDHWRKVLQARLDEKERLRLIAEARKRFVERYVGDVIKTSVRFLVQTDASITIQRVWRGHWSRVHNRPIPHKPPPSKRRVARRHGMDVLRRVWARNHYSPEQGWPGRANYLHYDMWEHADKPPKGRDYGLKTYKVIVAPRSEKELEILGTDKNAWVGLPISFCPFSEYLEEKANAQRKTMSQLEFNTRTMTPYGDPVIHMDPLKSKKPMELVARLHKNSYAYARLAEKELQRALREQKENETEEEARMRFKDNKFNNGNNSLEAIRRRKFRLEADKYFTKLANRGEDLDDELLVMGSVAEQLQENDSSQINSNNSIQEDAEEEEDHTYIPTKGVIRRGARKPLTKSQRNALREKADKNVNVKIVDAELGLNITTKYDVCTEALSAEEPRLLRLQAIARNNNYSAQRSKYVKLRNQFVHNYHPFRRTLEIKKGTNRDKEGLVNNTTWKSSSWAKLKDTVNTQLIESRTRNTKGGQNTLDPSEFVYNMIGTGVLESDVDSYISVWGRSVYKPPKEVQSRARVWAVKPKRHYKLKYTWLPQPILAPAVDKVFFEHTAVDDVNTNSPARLPSESSAVSPLPSPSPGKQKYYSKTWNPVEVPSPAARYRRDNGTGRERDSEPSGLLSELTTDALTISVRRN